MDDAAYMEQALALAREAAQEGEVPVGCIITLGDQVVGRGRNRRERSRNALSHGELEAIDQACKTLGGWRLWQCTLYVTLEPCPMCAGAIVNARIPRVVFGARDPKAGACGSVCDLFAARFNHHPAVTAGVLEEPWRPSAPGFFPGPQGGAAKPKKVEKAGIEKEAAAKEALQQPFFHPGGEECLWKTGTNG